MRKRRPTDEPIVHRNTLGCNTDPVAPPSCITGAISFVVDTVGQGWTRDDIEGVAKG